MKQLLVLSILFVSGLSVFSQNEATALRQAQFNLPKNKVAVEGYDVVAYFIDAKPKKGKAEFAVYHQGITYHFSSNNNKELFKKNPAQYEPQYGGWCAYAMGNDGSKVEVNPETFKILNSKLHLFYNKYFTNTLKSWNKDEARLMKSADANWMKFYH